MSFAAEMRDFYAGFRATYGVAADARDRIDKRNSTWNPNGADGDFKMFGPGASKGSSGGVKSSKYVPPSGDIKKVIDENVPEDMREYAYKMAYHESKYDPNAVSPTGAKGIFQFTKGTGANYGLLGQGGDMRSDPSLNTQAFVKFTEDNRRTLSKALGREPTYGELALAHQQGAGGALYLLTGKGDSKTMMQVQRGLKANGYDSPKGAAQKIAAFYGFDLAGDGPQGETAIPDPTYTQYSPGGETEDVAEDPQRPAYDAGTPDASSDGFDTAGLLRGSQNAAIDVDYGIPQGARQYAPRDLTQAPTTMYGAEGGTVPWKDEVSRLRRPNYGALPEYRPYQTYGAVTPPAPNKDPRGNGRNGNAFRKGPLKTGMAKLDRPISKFHGGQDGVFRAAGGYGNGGFNQGKMGYAEGGPISDNDEEVTSEVTALPVGAPAGTTTGTTIRKPAAALPPAPAGNPRGSNREDLAMEQRHGARPDPDTSTVIDAGLKYLTRSLGLDKAGAAVGADPDLRVKQTKLINGAIGPNEGPPTQQEVDDLYKVVDPDGQLEQGLRTIYTMKKGYDFYMRNGQPEKAAKFVAGIVQYSNLLAKQYGVAAVQAGKNGDEEGMVKYAIQSYDSIPDGMNVSVEKGENGYNVTRTDEDGNVVDEHQLTPQQIFQMATGISQGSGYFEALMEAGAPGTAAQRAKLKKAEQRTGNLNKLLPDLKADMEDGEEEAWASAVEDGDYETLQAIIGNVKTRRKERMQGEQRTAAEEARDRRILQGQEAILKRQEDRQTFQTEEADKRRKADDEKATKKQQEKDAADEAKRARKVKSLDKLKSGLNLRPEEKEAWKAAVENNDPDTLNLIIKGVRQREANPFTMIDQPKGATDDGDGADSKGTGDVDPPASALPPPATSQSNTSSLKRAPDAILTQARAAIAKKGRDAVVGLLKANGYSDEGL